MSVAQYDIPEPDRELAPSYYEALGRQLGVSGYKARAMFFEALKEVEERNARVYASRG